MTTSDARDLPSGVITFLFTDVVGSTKTWEREPEAMSIALRQLDTIMTAAVDEHHGVLIKIRGEGDSTFSVFQYASDAVHAAATAQRLIEEAPWPTSQPITMRVALHSGEAEERSGDYYGRTVNRAARLRSLATSGQVLISQTTRDLVAGRLEPGLRIESLGLRQLKDISEPEVVYTVLRAGAAPPPEVDIDALRNSRHVVRLQSSVQQASDAHLVGRTHEREVLQQCIERSRAGERYVVLVSGEAGLGKTSLCCRVATEQPSDQAIVLFGRCEADVTTPYRPFVEALGHLVREADDELLAAIGPHVLAELVPVVPDAAARLALPSVDRRGETDIDRFVLMNAIRSALARTAAVVPVLLIIEDLHWADEATRHTVRHLAQAADEMALTIVANYRDTDLDAGHPLRSLLAEIHRERNVTEIALDALSRDDLAELLQARLPSSGSDTGDDSLYSLADALATGTNGNPFFAGEIIRQLGDETHRSGATVAEIPASVGHVINQRIDRHGDIARRLLSIASVCGSSFDAGLVARVGEYSADGTLDVLEELQRARLVNETSIPERFRFAHGLVRQALYDELSVTRRARLHRRVAEQLEADLGADASEYPGELARHWENGAAPGDRPKVVHYARLAGDAALEQRAPQAALDWYEKARALGRPDDDAGAWCDLLIGLGEAQRQLGVSTANETLFDAVDRAADLGDTDRLTRAALAINRGMASSAGEVDDRKMRAIDLALDALGDADGPDRARLLALKGAELLYGGDYRQRRAISDDALAIARRVGDRVTLVHVLNERFLPITQPATAVERRDEADEAERLAAELGDLGAQFFAAHGGSMAALECGDEPTYARRLAVMGQIAEELQQPMLRWIHLWNEAVRLTSLGRLDDAQRCAQASLTLGLELQQPDALVNFGGIFGSIALHRGQLHSMADAIAQSAADFPAIAAYRLAHAMALAEGDDLDGAAVILERELADGFSALEDDLFASTGLSFCADIATRLQHPGAAEALIERMAPYRDLVVCAPTSCRGAYAHWLGGLYWVLGDHDEAHRLYAEAQAVHQRLGYPFFVALTDLEWGHRRSDVAMLHDAHDVATRHGFGGLVRRAEAHLA
jgi:class 3 adenylate cyclase/tetratricopeptide (TPR) repeat protein